MIADRTEENKRLDINSYFPPFFSVMIPEIGRPQYTIKCVESVHKFADLPVEIILHDDGSTVDKQRILFDKLRDRVSTMIFNNGRNTGLARSMNRCAYAASSKYLLELNNDAYMTSSFLKNMKAALDLPYVGLVNVTPKINKEKGTPGLHVTPEGVKVLLSRGSGTLDCMGIRKSVSIEAGWWDENVQTSASDTMFVGQIFGKGYFAVTVEGSVFNEMWSASPDGKWNIGNVDPAYITASEFTHGDNNPPPIFGLNSGTHFELSNKRREDIWHSLNDILLQDKLYPQWFGDFFCDQISKLYIGKSGIDWEFAKEYGHDKWKDRIINDFNLQ